MVVEGGEKAHACTIVTKYYYYYYMEKVETMHSSHVN